MPNTHVSREIYQAALDVAFGAARAVADRHRKKLMKDPNVIDVRAGFKFKDGWITDTPAVVVTVLQKGDPGSLGGQAIPHVLDGVPVDVAPATPGEQLRHVVRSESAGTRGTTSAFPLQGLPPANEFLEPGETPEVEEATRGGGANSRQYQEPKDLRLTAVGGAMTLLCHASPDAGWPNLQKFLAGTKESLTVAMYDFGAKHIVAAITGSMTKAKGKFLLNLDRKSNPKRAGEFTEEEIVRQFELSLGEKFVSSTAAVGTLYPNAYHIKVAVRDGSVFWISSGNWQGSNQPETDSTTLSEPEQRTLFSKHNREWHVICDSEKLAGTFEGYIRYDVAEAARVGERAVIPPPLPDLLAPVVPGLRGPARPVRVFKAKKFVFTAADRVKVQPVLTPDNYGEHVVPLILSAKKSLCFQNQYITIPKTFPDGGGKPGLKELAEAIRDRIDAGVDVKIILRNGGDTRPMLQALKVFGIPETNIRLLGGCHNKGIVVDSKAVLVSSQNYSADGVRYNRDAGLIIHHPDVAKYFEDIFLHDWLNRSSQRIAGETGEMPLVPQVAARTAGTRGGGMAESVSWEDFYGD